MRTTTFHKSHAALPARIGKRCRRAGLGLAIFAALMFGATACRTPPQAPAKAAVVPAQGPAFLGILYVSVDGAYRPELYGARIIEVLRDSPAQRAGLRVGDTILAANGERILDSRLLQVRIRGMHPGEELHLLVQRNTGATEEVRALLAAVPTSLEENAPLPADY